MRSRARTWCRTSVRRRRTALSPSSGGDASQRLSPVARNGEVGTPRIMAAIPPDRLDAAVWLLVQQGTVRDVAPHRLVSMCRRAGLAPADTVGLVLALAAETGRYTRHMGEQIAALAVQEVPIMGDTLRDLEGGTGWRRRD